MDEEEKPSRTPSQNVARRTLRGNSRVSGFKGSIRMMSQVPNEDHSSMLNQFNQRNDSDTPRPNYQKESLMVADGKYIGDDAADVLSREPSFAAFKIPYEMICSRRYRDSNRDYEAQLEHEIRQNIDFQRTAADACYFVRCMAYTTFWPPLHNMTEVKHTSKHFFQLSEKEKWRLKIIMNTDIT